MLWLGYIVTFEEVTSIPHFEAEPPEGYTYWMNKEFWSDVRSFTVHFFMATLAISIPVAAVLSLFGQIFRGRITSAILAVLSLLASFAWLYGIVLFMRRDDFHWIQIVPIILWIGATFASFVFCQHSKLAIRKRRSQTATTTIGVPTVPDPNL